MSVLQDWGCYKVQPKIWGMAEEADFPFCHKQMYLSLRDLWQLNARVL